MTDLYASLKSAQEAYEKTKASRIAEPAKQVRVYEYQLAGSPSWLIYFTAGVELDAAEKSLREKFGERLVNVREKK
jgi:hypothetical protein